MLWALDECVYARTKDMQRNTTQKAAGGACSMHPLRRRLYARGPECTVVSSSEHPSLSHDRLIWSGLGRKPVWYFRITSRITTTDARRRNIPRASRARPPSGTWAIEQFGDLDACRSRDMGQMASFHAQATPRSDHPFGARRLWTGSDQRWRRDAACSARGSRRT